MAYGDVCWECEGMWEAKIQFPGEISSFQGLSSPDSSPWVCQGFWWANKMPRVETIHPDHVENYTFSPCGRAPSHSRGQGPWVLTESAAAAAAKSLQSCPTLFDPIDGSPPDSPVPGILQARTLEWVAISFSNAWKWKVKVKSLSHVWPSATPWTAAYQAPPSMGFSRQEYRSGVPLPSPRLTESCFHLKQLIDCFISSWLGAI